MEILLPDDTEVAQVRDLELLLRTTLSILAYRTLRIGQHRSLLNLDSALRSAIAYLAQRQSDIPAPVNTCAGGRVSHSP